jgi:ABC-type Fe3+/spermidine/putrescine transport system ATPase subunit
LLQLDSISFNYSGASQFRGLHRISLKIKQGEFFAIVGLSGCGKTTLLKCIYGLEELQGGTIYLDEEVITGPNENLIPGHPEMKLVSQDYYVLDNHTVEENIRDLLIGYAESYKKKRTQFILNLLELKPLAKMKARDLSSGQKQRVAIARAFTKLPRVLLLDEPFSNLDAVLSEKLFYYLKSAVQQQGSTVVLVTHRADEALRHADRLAVMDNGTIRQSGPALQVYYHPKGYKLAGLLGVCNKIKTANNGKTLLIRPDQFIVSDKEGTWNGTVIGTTFNGKCYEWLVELSDNTIVVYHSARGTIGQHIHLSLKP